MKRKIPTQLPIVLLALLLTMLTLCAVACSEQTQAEVTSVDTAPRSEISKVTTESTVTSTAPLPTTAIVTTHAPVTTVPVTTIVPITTTVPVTTDHPPVTTTPTPGTVEPLTPEAITALENCGAAVYYGDSRIVAIDPGHQAKGMPEKEPNGPGSSVMKAMLTSGAAGVSTHIAEYELNLAVALKLRDELVARGYTVVMIRETNEVMLSNAQRAQIANAAGAGAFVRIHANGSENASVNGALTMCQTADNPYNGTLYGESRRLSECLIDAYVSKTGLRKRDIIETDTMTGINWADVPSTIIEMGFLSNAEEDELMATESFQISAAIGMADGLDAFFAD